MRRVKVGRGHCVKMNTKLHLCCQEVAHKRQRMFVRLTCRPRCIASHNEHFLQAASSYPGSQLSSMRRPVDTASRQVGNGSVAVRQEQLAKLLGGRNAAGRGAGDRDDGCRRQGAEAVDRRRQRDYFVAHTSQKCCCHRRLCQVDVYTRLSRARCRLPAAADDERHAVAIQAKG